MGIIIAAVILSILMMAIGVAMFCTDDSGEEIGLAIVIFIIGVVSLIISVNLPQPDNYGKKMLHHQYTIEYTNRVNSQNQVVSRDTIVVWEK